MVDIDHELDRGLHAIRCIEGMGAALPARLVPQYERARDLILEADRERQRLGFVPLVPALVLGAVAVAYYAMFEVAKTVKTMGTVTRATVREVMGRQVRLASWALTITGVLVAGAWAARAARGRRRR